MLAIQRRSGIIEMVIFANLGADYAYLKVKFMIRTLALTLVAGSVLVSCQSEGDGPYQPANKHEATEFDNAHLTVYPDDVRADLDRYTNTMVAWAGIIRSTDAIEAETGGKIYAATVFENHYFDWQQAKTQDGLQFLVSPGGEGSFRSELHLRKSTQEATANDAEKYLGRGRLAVLYGMPQSVDPDGTVVLKYRYIRVFARNRYNTNELEYGRLGQPIRPVGWNTINVPDRSKNVPDSSKTP
jgi:hypothetical protein